MRVCVRVRACVDNAMRAEYTDVDQKIQQYQAVGRQAAIPMAYRDVK
jgi:hypothetical protein